MPSDESPSPNALEVETEILRMEQEHVRQLFIYCHPMLESEAHAIKFGDDREGEVNHTVVVHEWMPAGALYITGSTLADMERSLVDEFAVDLKSLASFNDSYIPED